MYFIAALGLLCAAIVYSVISTILSNRYHARRAQELGCKPAFRRPHKYPLGIDLVWVLIQADKHHVVPSILWDIYEDLQHPTWIQNFLGTDNYVTNEPKNIQALLATQFNDFEIGPVRRANFFPMLGNGIFTSDGKSWEHSRALLRPQFARDQVSDLELEEVHVQDMFRHLATNLGGWTDNVDLSPLFFRLTLDSATEFLFGQSVNSQIAALPEHSSVQRSAKAGTLDWTSFAKCFDGGTMALGIRGRLAQGYWLFNPRSFRNNCKEVHKFADYYVNLALTTDLSALKEKDLEDGQKREKYIFLQELVKSTRDPIELRSQLLNILLAGRDTTAGLLGFVFYLLARHPEVFAKLRGTILDNFGSYSAPYDITFQNLKGCKYLQYVMSETLRLFATVPVNSRCATRDTTLPVGGGPDGKSKLYVRKGEEVNYVVHIMHRRKDIWGPDADQFKPERWEGRKPGWEFLPFNGGPRICLGQQFALTEAGYVIVRMLQRYDRIENMDTDPVTRHQYSVTTSPLHVSVRLHEDSN